eukprot:scaffold6550_cov74-Cyclotella_meneghiniana.AAC.6
MPRRKSDMCSTTTPAPTDMSSKDGTNDINTPQVARNESSNSLQTNEHDVESQSAINREVHLCTLPICEDDVVANDESSVEPTQMEICSEPLQESDTVSKSKVKCLSTAALIFFVVVFGTLIGARYISSRISLATSSNDDTSYITTKEEPSPFPTNSHLHDNRINNYNLELCNPIDGEYEEFCTAGNCLAGPHCFCEVYLRETESNSVIGICNSCRVCDFDDDEDREIEYSPPDSYTDRFCIPSIEPIAELCFAGECTNDERCRCDMYKRDAGTGDILGVCESCGVCTSGGISSDCTNVGLAEVACKNSDDAAPALAPDDDIVYSPPDSYIHRFCIPSFDPSTQLCYAGECTDDEKCCCEMYKKNAFTGDIVGVCDSCSVCSDGGISSDCTNVGLSKVICRNYDIHGTGNTTALQLNQGQPSSNDTNDSKGSKGEDDYSCAEPLNGVQLCHVQSCEEHGCTCDAYFQNFLTQQPVGDCSECMVCDNGSIGLVCNIYGIKFDLSC